MRSLTQSCERQRTQTITIIPTSKTSSKMQLKQQTPHYDILRLTQHSAVCTHMEHRIYATTGLARQAFRPMSTNFEEQRHVGKPGLSITRSTKEWDPIVARSPTGPPKSSLLSLQGHSKTFSTGDQSITTQSGVGTQIQSDAPLVSDDSRPYSAGTIEGINKVEEEKDENVYPGPLPLAFLIIGLCLSVFLISLDRTIITTVSSIPLDFVQGC